jgi:RNA polymerase sigma factor (sigma-70 family)
MNADAELLRRYAEESSQDAFTEFVARHIPLVYHAALRQLGGDAHRAHDVTQLVFTELARKAHALSTHPALVSWLHKSTRYAAAKVRRAEQARRKYEQEAVMHASETAPGERVPWERIRPAIDDALHELHERDRAAVLLRYFEGRSFAEIGAVLALTENGARMRVERALDKLHGLLARRGLAPTVAILAATLAEQAGAAVPAGLAVTVTGAALSGAAAGAGTFAAVWNFLFTSKATLALGSAAAVMATVMVAQTVRAGASARALAELRREHTALAARVAQLDANVAAAEKERSDRQVALERARVAEAAHAAQRAAADGKKARRDEALRLLLANDPEMRRLRTEANRAAVKADMSVGPLMASREEMGRRADVYVQRKEIQVAELARGIKSDIIVAAPSWDPAETVRELSNKLFYTDERLTKQQVTQLQAILLAAKSSDDGSLGLDGLFDWDRVLPAAARVLSPVQLGGLRAMAAHGRNAQMLAAAGKPKEASP